MSYQMRVDPKSRNSGRFVLRVQRELQEALERSGLRQHQVAQKLGVDRSIINRRFTGRANLTLRSIADIAWATDHDVFITLKPKTVVLKSNSDHKDISAGYQGSMTYNPVLAPAALGSSTPLTSSSSSSISKNKVTIQHESA